jgi:hypothetical protein
VLCLNAGETTNEQRQAVALINGTAIRATGAGYIVTPAGVGQITIARSESQTCEFFVTHVGNIVPEPTRHRTRVAGLTNGEVQVARL